jgi:hypothetical protein
VDCVYPIDPSINPSSINEVAANCPPEIIEDSPNDLSWIVNFQERTLSIGCSRLQPTDILAVYQHSNCVLLVP